MSTMLILSASVQSCSAGIGGTCTAHKGLSSQHKISVPDVQSIYLILKMLNIKKRKFYLKYTQPL